MIDAILSLFSGGNSLFVVLILGLIGSVVAFVTGRVDGASKERAKQDRDRLEAIKAKKEKDDEVDQLSPADVDQRLERWMRNQR